MSRNDTETIVGISLTVIGAFLISYYSNWQTAVGVSLLIIGNNIDRSILARKKQK